MHSSNITTPWEQTKNSFKSFIDKSKKNIHTAASEIQNKVRHEIEYFSNTNFHYTRNRWTMMEEKP